MPKLPGRESTFKTYQPAELLVDWFMGPHTRGQFRCVCCSEPFDGSDPQYGGGAVLEANLLAGPVGEVCGVCAERIMVAHPDHTVKEPPF
jgi:hypothetical protein